MGGPGGAHRSRAFEGPVCGMISVPGLPPTRCEHLCAFLSLSLHVHVWRVRVHVPVRSTREKMPHRHRQVWLLWHRQRPDSRGVRIVLTTALTA